MFAEHRTGSRRVVWVFVALIAVMAMHASAATVPLIDFDVQSDFDDNFTEVMGTGLAWNAGGYVASSANGHNVMVYDTDGALNGAGDVFDAAGGFVIDIDAHVAELARGVGLAFLGSTRSSKHWLLLQVDRTPVSGPGTVERASLRYGTDITNISGASAGTISDTYDLDTTVSLNEWYHMRLTVQLVNAGTQVQTKLEVFDSQAVLDGTTLVLTRDHTFSAANSITAPGEIAITTYSGQEVRVDNFSVAALIPEPAMVALMPLALAAIRRRR